MGFSLTSRAPEKGDPTAKNRVWGFFGDAEQSHRENRPQPKQPRQGNRPAPTKTASGRTYWPSRDPIGERGGVNLYSFVYNDSIDWIDILGREPWGGPANAVAETAGLRLGGGYNGAVANQGEKMKEELEPQMEDYKNLKGNLERELDAQNRRLRPPAPLPELDVPDGQCRYLCQRVGEGTIGGSKVCIYGNCSRVAGKSCPNISHKIIYEAAPWMKKDCDYVSGKCKKTKWRLMSREDAKKGDTLWNQNEIPDEFVPSW